MKRALTAALTAAALLLCGGCGVSAQPDIRPALGLPTGQLIRMPDLVGGSYEEAAALLAGRAEIVKEDLFTGRDDAGQILAQSIPAGTETDRGVQLTLTVSAGRPSAPVPDCAGLDYDDASDLLHKAGLRPELVAARGSEALWSVLRTVPEAGSSALIGSSVQVFVSAGSDAAFFEMPGFLGQQLSDVLAQADTLGLLVRAEAEPSRAPAGTVVAQSLPAGTECAAGTELRVLYSADSEEAAPLQ